MCPESTFLKRLQAKVEKENLWLFVLLLLKEKSRYGYELRRLIKSRFGFWSGEVTAYHVLYSLKRGELVSTTNRDSRKYYTITERGEETLKEGVVFLKELVEKVENEI